MYLRSAYVPHTEDGDFIQAGNLYCQVMSQTDRDHLVRNIVGHLSQGVERFIKDYCIDSSLTTDVNWLALPANLTFIVP